MNLRKRNQSLFMNSIKNLARKVKISYLEMETFNQVMPLDSSLKEYCGFISAGNEEFYIHLSIHDDKTSKNVHLRGCKKLQSALKPELETLRQHLNQCNSIKDMLSEIQNSLVQKSCASGLHQQTDLSTKYNILFEHLQECGWEKIQYLSSNFDELNLVASDTFDRKHILKLWIPEKYPNEAPRYECDLPQEFTYKWLPGDTLASLFSNFQDKLNAYFEFWNNMDEIDSKTWILEPEKPRRQDCKRRIALAANISLLLVVNPLMPTTIPTCNYMGPERMVELVREKFNQNIRLWSEYDSLLTNLQQVLELEFPSPTTVVKEEFCIECGICYSHLLGEAIPEINCDNSSCNQVFHKECLYEYIRMLPDVRSSFNKLFGQCPYCSSPLWCTIP